MIEILQLVALIAAVAVNLIAKKPAIKCEVINPVPVETMGTPPT